MLPKRRQSQARSTASNSMPVTPLITLSNASPSSGWARRWSHIDRPCTTSNAGPPVRIDSARPSIARVHATGDRKISRAE